MAIDGYDAAAARLPVPRGAMVDTISGGWRWSMLGHGSWNDPNCTRGEGNKHFKYQVLTFSCVQKIASFFSKFETVRFNLMVLAIPGLYLLKSI